MKASPVIIGCITAVLIVEIATVGAGVLLNRDTGQLVTFLGIVNAVSIPSFAALFKQESTDRKVESVNHRVNGHITKLMEIAASHGYSVDDEGNVTELANLKPTPPKEEPKA